MNMNERIKDQALQEWAEDPSTWGEPAEVLVGEAAAAYGRGLLQAAGVDVDELDRSVGRPRVGGPVTAAKGVRSPRVNVAISARAATELDELVLQRGMSRSDLVREALDEYLQRHPVAS